MKVKVQQDYVQLRKGEYPPITDQLDLIYHGGIDEWRSAIASVKAKYPKPSTKP